MSKVITATDENFNETISNGLVLVDFWATWCGPCKMIAPILDEIAAENEDIIIAKLDVDSNPEKSAEYKIRSIPTMIIFKDGKEIDTIKGAMPKNVIVKQLESKK